MVMYGVEKMKDRRKEICQYLHNYMEACFLQSCQLIQTEMEMCGSQIWNELKGKIFEIMKVTYKEQEQGKKGKMKYLVFSFLKSSILMDKVEFYIEALDEGFYLDEQEASAYYCPSFLQDKFTDDLSYLYQKVKEKFIRLQSYELTTIKEQYAEYYFSIVYNLIRNLSGQIANEIKKSGIGISECFTLTFGEYMGRTAIVYAKEKHGDELLSD